MRNFPTMPKAPSQRGLAATNGSRLGEFVPNPSREKVILENPQIFQNCEIINNFSADDAQSEAERIPNRDLESRQYL